MIVRRVPLDDSVKRALAPSYDRSNCDWVEIERWIAEGVAAAWQIGDSAYGVTFANEDGEIELLLGGGSGAIRHVPPFISAMENLPIHRGWTLRIEGRRGWKRFCPDWVCDEIGGGGVVLTRKV